jgi:tetratricopeptide (TPR) repeat protein/tRNA A-37 threonylcarbamoyl transferase component Bud32/TolB-like protein
VIGPCIIGEIVSHYEILEKLGEGGMGVVYKARDLRLQRFVALKFLSPEIASNAETIARFEIEARSISALNHPHIATIYSMDEAEWGRRFLVLEYLPGGTLRARLKDYRIRQEPFPIREAVKTAMEIAGGLDHAHRAGIVHRDIKPENVMFNVEGVLRITDFGLSKSAHSEELTRAGTTIGTAAYMAPEQASENNTSPLSDLFSLGILLHELIAGQRPFAGKSELATMHALVHDPPPPLRTIRPEVPPRLEKILLKLLDKEPERRYQTGESLAADLGDLYNDATNTAELNYEGVTKTMLGIGQVGRRRWLPALALAAIAAVAGAAWYEFREPAGTSTQLAVLPFTAKSGKPEDIAFGNGLAGILATRLSASGAHIWIVPGSDLQRNRVTTPDDARRVFGVRRVLTGTIDRQPQGPQVEMKLIDTASGKTLKQASVSSGNSSSTLQDDVMKQATAMLGVPSGPREAGETKASNAYDYYVQGNGYLQRYDQAGNVDAAIRSFEDAIKLDPNYALAYAGLGSSYWRKYKLSSDSQMLERARDAAMQALSRNDTLDAPHITLGDIAVSAGQPVEGIRQLNIALERDPVNADACRELANAYVAAGKLADAETTYRRAIQYRPDFWLGYFDLATFYNLQARYDDAEQALKKASGLTPDNYLIYRNLGGVQMARGEWSDAEHSFQKAIALRPIGSVYSNLGALYIYLGRYPEAIPVLEQAIALSGDERHAYLMWGNLGDACKWTPARKEDAARAYTKAAELATSQLQVNPKDPTLLSHIAEYRAKAGEDAAAEVQIMKALAIAPKDPAILFKAAIVRELAGKRKQSLTSLDAALAAGYSLSFVEREPELASLRAAPGYSVIAAHAKVR